MKLNYRVYKKLVDEPFLIQEINGKEVGMTHRFYSSLLWEVVFMFGHLMVTTINC